MNFEWLGKKIKASEMNVVILYDSSLKLLVDKNKLGKQVMLGIDKTNRAIAIKPVSENGKNVNIRGDEIRINSRPFTEKLKTLGLEKKKKYKAQWDEVECMFIVKY